MNAPPPQPEHSQTSPPLPPPLPTVRQETRSLLKLALPVVLAQVGMLGMGLVDTWMVASLGKVELAAVALGDAVFFTFGVLGMWLVRGAEPLIAQAYGAGDPARGASAYRIARWLAIGLTPPLALILFYAGPFLASSWGGQDPAVAASLEAYLIPRIFGVLPWMLYAADQGFLHGQGITRPQVFVIVVANVANFFLDWALIFGLWGLPALGVVGAGITTALTRWAMYGLQLIWVYHRERAPFRALVIPSWARLRTMLKIGIPLSLTHGLEVGAFSTASLIMGWLSVEALAAHQIAIKMAALAFMFAVGIGAAASIRVGHEIGARNPGAARQAGWVALGVGVVIQLAWGVVFVALNEEIVASFTDVPEVIALGGQLLLVAAAFQLSDSAQAIAAGALRGAGDTTWPLVANLTGHWVFGLPLAVLLAFQLELGPVAVWWSLAIALTLVAIGLLLRFAWLGDVEPLEEGYHSK